MEMQFLNIPFFLISNNEKIYSKGNFKIEVKQGLTNITIKIPIETISFSYEIIFFIAGNTKENYIIFEEPVNYCK